VEEIIIKDSAQLKDFLANNPDIANRLASGNVRTRVRMYDHTTGELLEEGSNKISVAGSQINACKQFGIPMIVQFPTYNSRLDLDYSVPDYTVDPENERIVCLWAVGRSGYATTANEILVPKNTDMIKTENDLMPFRYVPIGSDIDPDLRDTYFGRKTLENEGKIAYYFKAFDTKPQLHIRYLDGTQVDETLYDNTSSQQVEVYVETRLSVTSRDFRDYIDQVLGWDNATFSTISLLTAWYTTELQNPDADIEDQYSYITYQEILPFSKWNFKERDLGDLTSEYDFRYQIYY
jgi:hypothetical protein